MKRAAFVLLLVVAIAPAAASAGDVVGVLAVADPPGPGAALAAATEQLRAALAAAMPGVLSAPELRARMAPRPPRSSLAELRRAQAGAVAAYAAGEFESSAETLRAVVDGLEELPEDAAVLAEWTSAGLRLARTEQELGRRAGAQAALERVLRAAPETRPDARRYPPSFLALVEEVRERLRALGTRRLTVEAEAGARVFVDGREVGTAPVTVALAPGAHRVGAERGGVRAPPTAVELAAGDVVVQLDLPFAEALRPDDGPGLALAAADQPARLVPIAARLGLGRAVTVALRRDGDAVLLVGTLHDLRRGRAEREGRIRLEGGAPPPGAVEALAAFLATGRASALVATPAGPSLVLAAQPERAAAPLPLGAPAPGEGRRARVYGAWAVAAGVVAVAAAAVAVAYGRAASDRYASARAMLDPAGNVRPGLTVSRYDALIREGDARRDVAWQGATVSAAGLATAGVLSYVAYRALGDRSPSAATPAPTGHETPVPPSPQ